MALKVVWEDDALQLLLDRDRYARQEIRDEFRRNPEEGARQFDPDAFVTPVSNRRFLVVWYRDLARNQAVVKAVVPVTSFSADTDAAALKEYVQRTVLAQSKGAIVV